MALRHIALVAALGLTACAAPLRSFTDLEQARIDEYERAARQILESRGIKGVPPAVRIGDDAALSAMGRPAAYFTPRTGFADLGRPGRIMINRAVLADDLIAQAVLSHELAHFVLGHGDGRCQSHRHECEVEAHVASVELLMTGWDLDYCGRRPAPVRLSQERGPGGPARGAEPVARGRRPLSRARGVRGPFQDRLRLRLSAPMPFRHAQLRVPNPPNSLGLPALSLLD